MLSFLNFDAMTKGQGTQRESTVGGKYKAIMPALQAPIRRRKTREVVRQTPKIPAVTAKDLLRHSIQERMRLRKAQQDGENVTKTMGASKSKIQEGKRKRESSFEVFRTPMLDSGMTMMPMMDEYFLDHLPRTQNMFVSKSTMHAQSIPQTIIHDDFLPSYAGWEETSPSDVSMGSNQTFHEEMDYYFAGQDYNVTDCSSGYTDAEFERLFIAPTMAAGTDMPSFGEWFSTLQ
jgi:hypothetical protein